MVGTFIEVEGIGDFDMPYTKAILYSEEKRDIKTIVRNYCSLRGFDTPDKNYISLPYNMMRDTEDDLVEYLQKKENFKPVKIQTITIGD